MGRREAKQKVGPSCPKCGKQDLSRMASSETVDRYQCRDLNCFEDFTVPRESQLQERLDEERERQEETEMPKITCSMGCGKEFVQDGKRKESHQAKCTGQKKSGRRRAASKAPAPRSPVPADPVGFSPGVEVLSLLKSRRTGIQEQLEEVDRLIAAVTKAAGVDGDGDPT